MSFTSIFTAHPSTYSVLQLTMASYLRSIFWGRDSSSTSKSSNRHGDASLSINTKSHSRSRSGSSTTSSPTKAKHLKYLYAEPGAVPPAPIQSTNRERSNSLTAARANAPSPLRYTYDSSATRGGHHGHPHVPTHHTSHSLDGSSSKVPLYRTSSHKVGERRKPIFSPSMTGISCACSCPNTAPGI